MSARSACHVRFPGVSFVSAEEFDAYCTAQRSELDARFAYEAGFVIDGDAIAVDGTCAYCLRCTRFTCAAEGARRDQDDRAVPNWREQLVCDCTDRLGNRPRALLHLLQISAPLQPWSRVLLFGRAGALERRLLARLRHPHTIAALTTDPGFPCSRLDLPGAAMHVVISSDYLHRVPPLDLALAELRRVLMPGGRFVFTVPFRYRSTHTVSRTDHLPRPGGLLPVEAAGEVHELGWDLLGRLSQAGFTRARAHTYWSQELGYLGAFNMVFDATA